MRLGRVMLEVFRRTRALAAWGGVAFLLAGPASAQMCVACQGYGGDPRQSEESRRLFEKSWTSRDGTSTGDGLGPLFNGRSCVDCHHQGGVGGSGEKSRNVTILSAIPGASLVGACPSLYQGELEALHPGFKNHSSIVLHLQSTTAGEQARLEEIRGYTLVQTRDELFALSHSERSTPALFGAGRIDSIPDKALLEAEARKYPNFPEIKGRVSRLKGGRIGKFGWKGQTASLADFVLAACANEVGLEVPGHHQASLVSAKDFDPKKITLDLNANDCSQLTWFVAALPEPVIHRVGDAEWGFEVFKSIGCAACHTPSLGGVNRLYSDLLLHDLGDRMRAFGGGYGTRVTSEVVDVASAKREDPAASGEAKPTEWRTTPLWGVASSAPYLHDGRAPTLNEAINFHGGEAELTRKRYAALSHVDRQAVLAFLHSLVAPPEPGRPAERTARANRR